MKKILERAILLPIGGCFACSDWQDENESVTFVENDSNGEYSNSNKIHKKRNILIVTCAIAVLALIMCLITFKIIIPKTHYEKGIAYMETEEYDKAINEFSEAGNYRDSNLKSEEAKKLQEEKSEKDAYSAQLNKFKSACANCSSRTTFSLDGKSIFVDSMNKNDEQGIEDIIIIIDNLGLPNSLLAEMGTTNALMGRQTETYGNIQVIWSYHPDNGLDVIFKFLD